MILAPSIAGGLAYQVDTRFDWVGHANGHMRQQLAVCR